MNNLNTRWYFSTFGNEFKIISLSTHLMLEAQPNGEIVRLRSENQSLVQ